MGTRACDPDTDPGTVEHILPENPSDVWSEAFPPDHFENSVYRIGNLTLLEAATNREIGNSPYPHKRSAYGDSGYELTRQIADMAPELWTPDLIAGRQDALARHAVTIWKSDFV